MHDFQPYPIDLVEFNPFTKIGKEWALISAGNKLKFNTMTVSWGGLGVLWNKNVAYIFLLYLNQILLKNDFELLVAP